MRVEEIGHILPLGALNGSHVTPTDHGYYHPPNWKPQEASDPTKFRDILAPADGIIASIGSVGNRPNDYQIVINHTCTLYTIYIHVRELSPRIKPGIEVKAGEVIGRSNGFDFSVHDEEVRLPGFIVPAHYDTESWKVHTVDLFTYFTEPIRSQLLERNVRQKEPRSGKIDYDIDGRLVGNWFLEGTGGYGSGGITREYWIGHLAFAYNSLDPSLIIVSMGNFNGQPKQFAVKGNAPNPSDVHAASGVVKYELTGVEYTTEEGAWWDRISFAKISRAVGIGPVEGVVLVQILEQRRLKFEAFPGKTAAEVLDFTPAAGIYER